MHLIGKIILCALLLLLVVVGLVVADVLQYRVNITASLPRGIYKITHESIAPGVIVEECLPLEFVVLGKERGYLQEGGCPGNAMPILKYVVGIEGDEIELTDTYVAVNGRLIFNSETRKTDSNGRAMPVYPRGKFTLSAGEVFLLATHNEKSWDSRYMGPAKITNVTATLRPVLTEG